MKTLPSLCCLLSLAVTLARGADSATLSWPIIHREGTELREGTKPFRFLGLAAPNLEHHESQLRPDASNRFPDEFETRDLLDTLHRLGARATRSFTLSVVSPLDGTMPAYLTGRRQYNEAAFRSLDRTLALCREYDVRVIIPILASQSFPKVRGIDEFAALSGHREVGAFWTDPEVKADFRALLAYLANRRNTVSGVLYRDDPAILGWQLGNELDSYPSDRKLDAAVWRQRITAWSVEMSAALKQADPNHLVFEGGGDRAVYLACPTIDVLSTHLYEYWNRLGGGETDLTKCLQADLAQVAGRKPLVVDEFGLASLANVRALMQSIREGPVVGGLIWSLRVHRRDGGFYYHNEGGTPVNSYHFPGFPAGDAYDETAIFRLLASEAALINGRPAAPAPPPAPAPVLFPTAHGLTWRGSTGASGYDLECADTAAGPWQSCATNLPDSLPLDVPAYEASGAWEPLTFWAPPADQTKTPRFYRLRAHNDAGTSDYSEPLRYPKL